MYEKNVSPLYEEAEDAGNGYRAAYLDGIRALIRRRRETLEPERHAFGRSIAVDREKARGAYGRMLGWPLGSPASSPVPVREIPVFEDAEKSITRLVLEILPGVPFYGILFRHKAAEPLPLVLSQHGGLGTPEICSSFVDSANYNDMTVRLFRKGVHVFAPQTLLWGSPRFGVPNDRSAVDNDLKQLGSSVTALEIWGLMRALDYLETRPFCDGRFGMAGVSYGGFYTLYAAAAEPRSRASLAVCHFNDRLRYNWPDKVWAGSAQRFLDAEVGALVCPRFLRIEVAARDEIFDPEGAEREYVVLRDYYAEAPGNLEFRVFDGVHEFCPDDQGIDRLIGALKEGSPTETV